VNNRTIWLRIRRLCVRITPGALLNTKDLRINGDSIGAVDSATFAKVVNC
jgi:hypothetical protein